MLRQERKLLNRFNELTFRLLDNCTWISPGPQDKLPRAGSFKGKQGIAIFFARVGENLEFSEVAPREMIVQGDTVVALGTTT